MNFAKSRHSESPYSCYLLLIMVYWSSFCFEEIIHNTTIEETLTFCGIVDKAITFIVFGRVWYSWLLRSAHCLSYKSVLNSSFISFRFQQILWFGFIFSGLTIQANMYSKMLTNWTSQKMKEACATRNAFDFKHGMVIEMFKIKATYIQKVRKFNLYNFYCPFCLPIVDAIVLWTWLWFLIHGLMSLAILTEFNVSLCCIRCCNLLSTKLQHV